MTAAAVLRMLAEQGASQVAVTALHVLVWPGIALAIALPALAWRRHHQRRTRITHLVFLPPAEPCPCCTTSPRESDDCTCREDCGVSWCQAADPEEIGDDVIALIKRAREEDQAEADEFDALIAEWDRQQGDGRG